MLKESIKSKEDLKYEIAELLNKFSKGKISHLDIVEALWQDPEVRFEEKGFDVDTYDRQVIMNKQLAEIVELKERVGDLEEKIDTIQSSSNYCDPNPGAMLFQLMWEKCVLEKKLKDLQEE